MEPTIGFDLYWTCRRQFSSSSKFAIATLGWGRLKVNGVGTWEETMTGGGQFYWRVIRWVATEATVDRFSITPVHERAEGNTPPGGARLLEKRGFHFHIPHIKSEISDFRFQISDLELMIPATTVFPSV